MTLWRGKYLLIIKEISMITSWVICKRDINSSLETALCLKLSQFSCCWNKTMNWTHFDMLWFNFTLGLNLIILCLSLPYITTPQNEWK